MAVTALALVNRVLRKLRDEDVNDFSTPKSLGILDLINESMREILESRDWPFDIRHDGVFVTRPTFTETGNASVLLGSTALSFNDFTGSVTASTNGPLTYGDYITRVVVTSDTTYPNVSRKAVTATHTVFAAPAPDITALVMDVAWPGATSTAANAFVFVAEYVFAATTRKIISMKDEEKEIAFEEIDPTLSFDEIIPRPHDTTGEPEYIGVGGHEVSTYQVGTTAPEPRLRMIIWPVPSTARILHYSYYVNHSEMSETTDTISGVPNTITDDIVDLAFAKTQLSGLGNDPTLAGANLMRLAAVNRQKAGTKDPDPGRRFVLASLDRKRRSANRRFGVVPKDVGSL